MSRLPRKVLHVMNNAGGGAAISTVSLMKALRDHGIRSAAAVHAVGSKEERQAILDATDGDALFTVLYFWNRKFRSPLLRRPIEELKQGVRTGWARKSAGAVAGHAARLGADLLHTNTILNPEGGIAATTLGLPHVWHVRELVGPGGWHRLPRSGASLGAYLDRSCSKLVANSETAARPFRGVVPEDLLEVALNGIDVTRFTDERVGDPDSVVVAMVANMASHFKKHALFVEAAGRVDRALPVEFRIYGRDPTGGRVGLSAYVDDIRARIARLGLSGRFTFRGFVQEPSAIMKEIDVLLHPSDLESFGRIIAEAMAASRPVISVRGGAAEELVDDPVTGLLAPADDAAALARHIEALARDAGRRRQMGIAGRKRVEQRFSLDSHVARMLDVYAGAMRRPVGVARTTGAIALPRAAR